MSKASKATKLATRTAADEERAAQTMAVVREPAHDGWRPAGEHAALGKAARKAVPLSAHAGWTPAPDRPDPIALLRSQDGARVPELVPIRYGRMLRLAVHVLPRRGAADGRRPGRRRRSRGCACQLCGDAHLSNFGVFASPERRLVFDVNDFDETLPGPWEWDVKRLAASLRDRRRATTGSRAKDRREIVLGTVASYRRRCASFAAHDRPATSGTRTLDVDELSPELRSSSRRAGQGGRARCWPRRAPATACRRFGKLTDASSTASRASSSDPPLIVPIDELRRDAGRPRDLRSAAAPARRVPADAASRPAAPARAVHASSTWPARSSASAASARAPGSCCCMGRDDGDPLFLQAEGGRRRRCSRRYAGPQPRTTTTASASWPGSG